jgi:hypothetical protein
MLELDKPNGGGSTVPGSGLQRSMRSGRGLPMAFLSVPEKKLA